MDTISNLSTMDQITSITSGSSAFGIDTSGNLYYGNSASISLPKDIPVIYTIINAVVKGSKAYITYTGIEGYPIVETQGSVCFTNGTVGVFSKGDNHYWNNKIIVEFESEEQARKSTTDKFTLLNQWEKKLGNDELVKSLTDSSYYYSLVHSIIEDNVSALLKRDAHKQLDKELNLKDYD